MKKIKIENVGIILNDESDDHHFHSSLLLNDEVITQLNTKHEVTAEEFIVNFILDHSLRRSKSLFSIQQPPTQLK